MSEFDTITGIPGTPKDWDFPSVEDLQTRATDIVTSITTAIENESLQKDAIRLLATDAPREHADILAVFLGLKPAANFLSYGVFGKTDFYDLGYQLAPYVDVLQRTSAIPVLSGIETHWQNDTMIVWNPEWIQHVLEENSDITQGSLIDPWDNSSFPHFVEVIGGLYDSPSPDQNILQGLILGIPRQAAEEYATFADELYWITLEVADATEGSDNAIFTTDTHETPLMQLLTNENGTREKTITFIQEASYEVSDDLLSYMERMRPAGVPGFPYTTSGATSAHERRYTASWQASGIEEKINAFLAN
jgi:hypothetical protein